MYDDLYMVADWFLDTFVYSAQQLYNLGWIGSAVILLPLIAIVFGIFKKIF